MSVEEVPGSALKEGDVIIPWHTKQAKIIGFDQYRGPYDFVERIAVLQPYGANGFVGSGISLTKGTTYRRVTLTGR